MSEIEYFGRYLTKTELLCVFGVLDESYHFPHQWHSSRFCAEKHSSLMAFQHALMVNVKMRQSFSSLQVEWSRRVILCLLWEPHRGQGCVCLTKASVDQQQNSTRSPN